MSTHRYFSRDAPYILSVEIKRLRPSTPSFSPLPSSPPPPPLPFSSSHPSDKRDYTAEKSVPGLKDRSQARKSFCIIWTAFRCLRVKNQLHLWWWKWKPAFAQPCLEEEEGEKEEEEEEEDGEGEKDRRRRRRRTGRRREGGRNSPAPWCLLQPGAVPLESGAAGELCGILVGM